MQNEHKREISIAKLAREIDPAAFVDDAGRYFQSASHNREQISAVNAATQIVDSEWLCQYEHEVAAQTIVLLIQACRAFQEDPNYSRDTFDISAVLDWLQEAEVKFRDGTFAP